MNKTCYYCNNEIPFDTINSLNCEFCTNKYNLHAVYTTWRVDEILYVHIYIKLKNMGDYHVRLHLRKNITYILKGVIDNNGAHNFDEIMTVPNCIFTPANVAEKLPIYLLLK